jgi:hypothetical protein
MPGAINTSESQAEAFGVGANRELSMLGEMIRELQSGDFVLVCSAISVHGHPCINPIGFKLLSDLRTSSEGWMGGLDGKSHLQAPRFTWAASWALSRG